MPQAKTLNAQELRRVLDYVATRKHAERNRTMLLMTHYAGLRVGEVSALRVGDVVGRDGRVRDEINLTADQTKGDRGRTVMIGEKLRKELTRYITACPCANPEYKLFYTQKRMRDGFSPNTLTNHFYHLYRGCQIDGASSHSGRRSFLTSLSEKGVGVRVLMQLAGHRHIGTTQRYLDCNPAQLKAAVDLV